VVEHHPLEPAMLSPTDSLCEDLILDHGASRRRTLLSIFVTNMRLHFFDHPNRLMRPDYRMGANDKTL
jgi:hypothetical protein